MKILIISPGYLPVTGNHGGAIETLINLYLNFNENQKDKIVVYSVNHPIFGEDKQIYNNTEFRVIDTQKMINKIKIFFLKCINKIVFQITNERMRFYYLRIIKDLKKRHEENFYDEIIFENGHDDILFFKKHIKTNSKLILHLHNDYLYNGSNNCREVYNNFDEIWTVSDFIRDRVNSIPHYGKDKTKTIYNAVDSSLFQRKITEVEKLRLRKKHDIKKKDVVFVYVGRIMPEKGMTELIDAFNVINKRFKNTKLLVCGSSKSIGKTDGYVKQIRKKACDGVVFVGQIYNDDLYKYYQLSDCQIIPSKLNEAFGLIALEGVASGLQVFTTKQGALPEVLNNYAEWLDVNNLEESIENSMLKVIKNNEKPSLKIETSEKILSIFSQKNYFENLYSSIHQIRCDNKNQSIKNINIIMRNNDGNKNAGYKANDDILKFLSNSYSNINRYIVRENKSGIIQLFLDLLKVKNKQSLLLYQAPLHNRLLSKIPFNFKNSIVIIHDIKGLRSGNIKQITDEIKMYNKFDYIVIHNDSMKNFLISNGIDKDKIINLEFFDYLCEKQTNKKTRIRKIQSDASIVYMGNLVYEKSPFLRQLDPSKMRFNINAFGDGGEDIKNSKINLMGSVEPDEAPNKIVGDLGLVWDGNFDESDENIGAKNYTKYNNPHKFSCYLAAGIPVIAWEKAAIADTIKKYNIGYTIRNIYDINNLDFSDYEIKCKNTIEIGKKIRSGYYTKRAINGALGKMGSAE